MRCPSCGTENEPDSRFCGGCGARLAGESRLAPTQKIDTGAQPVQTPAQAVVQRTPSQSPDSRPPRNVSGQQNVPPASYPLTPSVNRPPSASKPQPAALPHSNGVSSPAAVAQSVQPTSQQRKPKLDPSMSIAPPKRRIGLIIAVLLVDLALAGAGAYMLAEGLSSSPASPSASQSGSSATPAPAPTTPKANPGSGSAAAKPGAGSGSSAALGSAAPDSEAPATNAVASTPPSPPPDAAAPIVTPIDAAAAIASEPPPDAAVATTKKQKTNAQSRKKKKTGKLTTQPVDPYDEGPGDPFPPDIPPPPPPPPSQ